MKRFSIRDAKSNSFQEVFLSSITPELNGSSGRFRAPKKYKLITPSNDFEAISAFLLMHSHSANTFRAYEKQLTRLHMWAVMKAGIALSSMTLEHYRNYIKFMSEPDDDWCGPRTTIGTSGWRPFQPKKYDANNNLIKPPISSLITAIATINSFIDWLCNGGYLIGNPLKIIKSEFINKNPPTTREVDRNSNYFDKNSFISLKQTLESMPRQTIWDIHNYEVKRILLSLIYNLNAKTAEISSAKMSNFIEVNGKWYWILDRKNINVDSISLNKEMLDNLKRWRLHLHLSELPDRNDMMPLLPPVNKSCKPLHCRGGLGPRRITDLLRELILATSKTIAITNPDKALQLQFATSHWIRYTKLREIASLKKISF
ncbi:MAG: hypothetical protein Q8R74_03250 [Methylophilus sp.]|nr:hypothetical protein [Methylophilus sp.]